MKGLFELPELLTLDGRQVTEMSLMDDDEVGPNSCKVGCNSGCNSGCDVGQGF